MLCIHVLPLLTAFVFLYGGIQHSKLAQDLRNVELLPDVVDSFGFLSLESRQFTAGAISCSSNCLLSSEKICIQRQEDAFAWVPLNIIFRFFIILLPCMVFIAFLINFRLNIVKITHDELVQALVVEDDQENLTNGSYSAEQSTHVRDKVQTTVHTPEVVLLV